MYTLYYSPGACSMSVHITLLECGAEYDPVRVRISEGEHKAPDYLKINPRGQVGALMTPDGLMAENAAMIIYINDLHGHKVIPASGFARAKALQWLLFANSTLHPAWGKVMFVKRNDLGEKALALALEAFQKEWDGVEEHLEREGTDFLAGDTPTAGDIYLAIIANWPSAEDRPTFGPKTENLIRSVIARPAYQKAIALEDITYNAVAA